MSHRIFFKAATGSDPTPGAGAPPQATGCPVSDASTSSTTPPAGCSSDSIRGGGQQQQQAAGCSFAAGGAAAGAAAAADHSSRINMDVVPNAPVASTSGRGTGSSSADANPSLSTHRAMSSIPMAPLEQVPQHQQAGGDTGDSVWVYPSEQQFFNAMKRKGWTPTEGDMSKVVAIHNTVNERAWQHILTWEALHACDCAQPRLKRFQGKPNEFSPKARLLNFLGFKLPFDRHDWVVDRCGTEVRYIIDFYSGAPQPGVPASMHLDVRPALDSIGALYDRLKMQARWVASGRWQD